MSRELINRITIKKDGVYISTHSSNDTSPFYSNKSSNLTNSYIKDGQIGLDKEILKMLLNYGELVGNHKSVIPYQKALDDLYNSKTKASLGKVRSLEDLLWNYDYNLKNNPDYKKIVGMTKNELKTEYNKEYDKLLTELANLVQDYRQKLEKENIKTTYNLYALVQNSKSDPFIVPISSCNSLDQTEIYRKGFIERNNGAPVIPTNKTELNNKVEILNTWITSYLEPKNLILEQKVEKLYMDNFCKDIINSLNGNIIYDLNDANLLPEEEKLFLDIVKNDERVIDFEYNRNENTLDVIVGLDYCPNAEKEEESEEEI